MECNGVSIKPPLVHSSRHSMLTVPSRDIERDLLPMARHYNMAVIPWSALGSGRFRNPEALEAAIEKGEFTEDLDQVKYSRKLYEIAKRRGMDSFAPIALAYLFAKYPLVFPIVGFQTPEVSPSYSLRSGVSRSLMNEKLTKG